MVKTRSQSKYIVGSETRTPDDPPKPKARTTRRRREQKTRRRSRVKSLDSVRKMFRFLRVDPLLADDDYCYNKLPGQLYPNFNSQDLPLCRRREPKRRKPQVHTHIHIDFSNSLRPKAMNKKQLARVQKYMSRLRLPYLHRDAGIGWSSKERLKSLRWTFAKRYFPPSDFLTPIEGTLEESQRSVPVTHWSPLCDTPRSKTSTKPKLPVSFSSHRAPRLSASPYFPPVPYAEIPNTESSRTSRRFGKSSFQIPTDFRPFTTSELSSAIRVKRGTIDSIVPRNLDSRVRRETMDLAHSLDSDRYPPSKHPPLEAFMGSSGLPIFERAPSDSSEDSAPRLSVTKYVPKDTVELNLLNEWEMLFSMEPGAGNWTYQDPEILRIREEQRHVAAFLPEEKSHGFLYTNLSSAYNRYLTFTPENATAMEEGYRRAAGRVLADLITTEHLPAHCGYTTLPKSVSGKGDEGMYIDVACIPTKATLPWSTNLPLILAAQYEEHGDQIAAESLASAFHKTLVMLILYYLDTRRSVNEDLPPWMFLYGVIYGDSGFIIQGHYPVFYRNIPGDLETNQSGWGAVSFTACDKFINIFKDPPRLRGRSIAALQRVVGHAQNVIENLSSWKVSKKVIAQCPLDI